MGSLKMFPRSNQNRKSVDRNLCWIWPKNT